MLNRDIVLTREQLLSAVWGYSYAGDSNIVDVYVRYVRIRLHEPGDSNSSRRSGELAMSLEARRKRGNLSRRITATYALLFFLMLLLMSLSVYFAAYRYLVGRQEGRLEANAEIISDKILEEVRGGDTLTNGEMLSELNSDANLTLLVKDASGEIVNRSRNFRIDEAQVPAILGKPVLYSSKDGQMLLCYEEDVADEAGSVGSLILVANMQDESAFLRLLRGLLLGVNALGALIALAAGWFTTRRMLSPIGNMIQKARTIDSQVLSARLDVPETDDELRSLALTINEMLDRVESAFVRQGQFTQDASHEFRTPLSILQGNADLLARWGKDDPEVRDKCVLSIQRQVAYMHRLVENLLFLARGDSGQQIVKAERIDLNQFLVEVIEQHREVDSGHIYSLDSDGSVALEADSVLLKQLLYILMDNAAKYTKEGGAIRLRYARSNGRVDLCVADEGGGIGPEHLSHIFERFYRLDMARSRTTGGMGLGLSIAQAIVRLHAGTIAAESELGVGTRITASFPG